MSSGDLTVRFKRSVVWAKPHLDRGWLDDDPIHMALNQLARTAVVQITYKIFRTFGTDGFFIQ
jgi:hypothetical protein